MNHLLKKWLTIGGTMLSSCFIVFHFLSFPLISSAPSVSFHFLPLCFFPLLFLFLIICFLPLFHVLFPWQLKSLYLLSFQQLTDKSLKDITLFYRNFPLFTPPPHHFHLFLSLTPTHAP